MLTAEQEGDLLLVEARGQDDDTLGTGQDTVTFQGHHGGTRPAAHRRLGHVRIKLTSYPPVLSTGYFMV